MDLSNVKNLVKKIFKDEAFDKIRIYDINTNNGKYIVLEKVFSIGYAGENVVVKMPEKEVQQSWMLDSNKKYFWKRVPKSKELKHDMKKIKNVKISNVNIIGEFEI